MATKAAERAIRAAPFALRVVQRRQGLAAIIYRRRVNARMEERFDKVAAISALAFTAGAGLLRAAAQLDGALAPPAGAAPHAPLRTAPSRHPRFPCRPSAP